LPLNSLNIFYNILLNIETIISENSFVNGK